MKKPDPETINIDEAIKHCEKVASGHERNCEIFIDDVELYAINKEWADNYHHIAEWLRELKRDREILDGLSIYFQSLVVDAVINQRPLIFDMRDATKEEKESVKRYIANSAYTTGVNFWSLIGEVNTDEDSD